MHQFDCSSISWYIGSIPDEWSNDCLTGVSCREFCWEWGEWHDHENSCDMGIIPSFPSRLARTTVSFWCIGLVKLSARLGWWPPSCLNKRLIIWDVDNDFYRKSALPRKMSTTWKSQSFLKYLELPTKLITQSKSRNCENNCPKFNHEIFSCPSPKIWDSQQLGDTSPKKSNLAFWGVNPLIFFPHIP